MRFALVSLAIVFVFVVVPFSVCNQGCKMIILLLHLLLFSYQH